MQNTPNISARQVVYQDRYQEIYKVTADFGEFQKEYFVREAGHKAGMVAVKDDAILLVKQYRFLINGLSWEIPGGRVDEGETPADAAVRECLEETGARCLNPQPLIFYHAGLDTTHNPTHIFYSEQIAEAVEAHRFHPEEVSGTEWVPLAECIKMIFSQEILDSFSIVALLAYQTLKSKP